MKLTLRRRILRAGLIRAQALETTTWHPRRERAKRAQIRLLLRLASSDV